jgi:aryl-alcohol dehydrogenase-like predicted oxidoreductase
MPKLNRRKFIGSIAAAGVVAASGGCARSAESASLEPSPFPVDPAVKRPSDAVPLGRSGLRVSVVGIGTGSIGVGGSSNQTRLGQETFTRLMRHSLDRGVTLFDLADQYGSNPFFGRAVSGVARDRYVIQTKTNSRDPERARADVDRFLKELGTDYLDSVLIHCVTEADWTSRYRGVMDVLAEAREKGKIRAHGVTCHSFEALRAAEASEWVQINQVRWNPKGAHMDADVDEARALFTKMRARGQGMIGMKVVGQGDLVKGGRALSPDECFRFQIESGVVDAFVVGVESVEQIDRLFDGTSVALAEVGYRAAHA